MGGGVESKNVQEIRKGIIRGMPMCARSFGIEGARSWRWDLSKKTREEKKRDGGGYVKWRRRNMERLGYAL